jgi:hypothetical protein
LKRWIDKKKDRSPADPLSPQEIAELFPHLKDFRATTPFENCVRPCPCTRERTFTHASVARQRRRGTIRAVVIRSSETLSFFANGGMDTDASDGTEFLVEPNWKICPWLWM